MTMSSTAIPFQTRLKALLLQLQFVWFLGHAALVCCSIFYILGISRSAYYNALLGALVSYAIVVYKTFGKPTFDSGFLRKMAVDANLQYLALALFFYMNYYPLGGILFTYVAFSTFHILSYIKDIAIPTLFPARPQPAALAGLVTKIRTLTTTYQPKALVTVAFWEILFVMPQLIIQVLTGKQSIFAPFLFAQFLRIRFNLSSTYKLAFTQIRQTVDQKLSPYQNQPGLSGMVYKAWCWFRDTLVRFGHLQGSQSAPPAPDRNR